MASDKLILTLLKEVRDEQKDHTETLYRLEGNVEKNTEDLEEHMKQTEAVRTLVLDHKEQWDTRLSNLEKIKFKAEAGKDFFDKVKGKILTISKILTSIGAIIGLIYSWFNNLFSALYNFFF